MRKGLEPLDVGVLQIPHYFRCPISLELMRDPVTVSTGQTYDRDSIEKWIATGNSTCPVTRAPLTDFAVIPNHALRRLIQDWCVAHRSAGIERIPTPKQPADQVTVRSLLSQASSESTPLSCRISALRRLKGLARDSDKNRSLISAQNASKILISIVFSDQSRESNLLPHESLATLSMLPLSELECASVASDDGRIGYLVSLLFNSSIEVRVNSAAVIEMVITGTTSPELRLQVGDSNEIYEGIVGILNWPLANPRALRIGIRTLLALCLLKSHRHKAVAAGAVEALINKVPDLEKCDAERALAAAELLCRTPAGCEAFGRHALTVPLLVKAVLKMSERATEYAAGTLLSLCTASEGCRREAVAAGVLTQMLLVVQSECTERAKRKAQSLLKLLRDSWPEHSVDNSDDYGLSDVVPF